ncbi:hypothetical protein [Pedobacter sp. MR22-3]|uniref:hypothetical protein n=1 Tax=Pedobacter sp. MR22-3 TaxID=2994552 RepID=UPI0022486B54|nr:hypothetical protein [Pedobacter sp. MR22-3]MCX2585033.1 hypothetical protein [Pedobacter sp. MR22-3]
MKKILLLSPFPPTQNPRLLKEYDVLLAYGYHVKVIYGEKDKWSSKLNKKSDKNFIRVGGKPGSIVHILTRIIQKLLNFVSPVEWNYNRVSWLLYFKAIFFKADLYIGHNLAALPIVAKLAKLHHSKYGFDAEDFYRQIDNDNLAGPSFQKAKYLEDKYLVHAAYLTAASPLIAKHYAILYPSIHPIVVNNVFSNPCPKSDQYLKKVSQLKLFWFSQTIGKNRGLEDIIEALNLVGNPLIELHLLGNLSVQDTIYFNGLANFVIKYYKPISADQIFELAHNFDIGLALEPGFCLNNEIALSNKIFTYLISGLAIIASDTQAQKEFMTSNTIIGELYPIGDVTALANIITKLFNNRDLLNTYRKNSYKLAKSKYNWEMEQEKFLTIIKSLVS